MRSHKKRKGAPSFVSGFHSLHHPYFHNSFLDDLLKVQQAFLSFVIILLLLDQCHFFITSKKKSSAVEIL
jgi:hypothetical protein